ncbi:hypothetical protein CPT_Melville_123 [Salmonella phage Melville]|uniref:Uncharacterized protein n=1 Tax=Salmonella phage Melville TaxID=2041413 RepID=A0A2D1GM44_9CAUD|nr:hypothetical protein FDI73_gp123 [Salmonella phage Melville]ATN93097.1 hypothetical protein CPT_Melville_123 [Salmonella phage Melville]UPW42495.1 hypothetical protein EBPHNEJP_00197 [Salmonella phage CF-SP2]
MTGHDFVLRDKELGSFYYYIYDPEFGGWQTGSFMEADSFSTYEEAELEIKESNLNAAIHRRTITLEE